MSVLGKKGTGIPLCLLMEMEGHTVSVSVKNGSLYRGKVLSSEDCWNVHLKDASCTTAKGKTSLLRNIYLRGDQVEFIVLTSMLATGPMFQRVVAFKGGETTPAAIGGAKASAIIAKAHKRRVN